MSQRRVSRRRRTASRAAAADRRGALLPLLLAGLALAALAGAGAIVLRPGGSTASAAPAAPPIAAAPRTATVAAEAGPAGSSGPGPAAVTAENGVVRLAAGDLADGRARFYTFRAAAKTITFFVLKSSDGVIRAAFDACDVCFPADKGYHQEGDEMVCNNCGTRFPSARINEVSGGCNPAPLARQAQGDAVTIKASDLEAGARYF